MDFWDEPTSLNLQAPELRSCFNLHIIDDNKYEFRESLFVNLTTTEPDVTLMPSFAVVHIDDNESECEFILL